MCRHIFYSLIFFRRLAKVKKNGKLLSMTVLLQTITYSFLIIVTLVTSYTNTYASMEVDVELVLAVDVSRSMDSDEIRLQREGYKAAFQHPNVLRAIRSGLHGRIAVTYIEWADSGRAKVTVPWMIIDSQSSAARFSNTLSQAELLRMRRTSIGDALVFAAAQFDINSFSGARRVIDISGDGRNNSGVSLSTARHLVISRGITINGLPILLKKSLSYSTGKNSQIDVYYEDCVIGGPGAFIVPVKALDEFIDAIRKKIILEVAGLQPRLRNAQLLYKPQPRVSCQEYD